MASIPRDIKLYRGAADPGQEGADREGGGDEEPRAEGEKEIERQRGKGSAYSSNEERFYHACSCASLRHVDFLK